MSICGAVDIESYVAELTDIELDDLETILCDCFDHKNIHEAFIEAIRREKEQRGSNI